MNPKSSSPWPFGHRRAFKRKSSYRFAVLNWGTRGDIQPFAALGEELVRRGHQVVLAAREPYRALVEERGIEFHTMREDGTESLMRTLAACQSLPKMLTTSTAYSRRIAPSQLEAFWEASRGADVILAKVITTPEAIHVAEGRGLPLFNVHFDPGFIPTSAYCFVDGRIQDKGALFNRGLSSFMLLSFGLFLSDKINAWRRAHGLRLDPLATRNWAQHLSRFPAFAAWSAYFLPRPEDWPARVVQTGWWILPHKGPIDPRLRDFLRAGPPPVYVGFGSWGVHEKTAVTDIVLETLRLTGNRGVLLRNTVDGRAEYPPEVLVADEFPHDWLLPRTKAAVHHGGAGTTGAAITAGIPSIIVPSFGMQAAWGRLVADRSIGLTFGRDEMTVPRMAEALRRLEDPRMRERAYSLGALARKEGGQRQAADEIERRLWEAAEVAPVHPVPTPIEKPLDLRRASAAHKPPLNPEFGAPSPSLLGRDGEKPDRVVDEEEYRP
ncbi:MAG: glycosyltransferase family 1 protein [Anaerolineales bacterium]|nr:glycosyltransferase family 1 protein [Anaerolineales bacterium]